MTLLAGALAAEVTAATAAPAEPRPLPLERPSWLHAADFVSPGHSLPAPLDAPLPSQIGLRPGVQMVSPSVCTMNFIFKKKERLAIGTAAHCLYDFATAQLKKDPVVVHTLHPRTATATPVVVRLGSIIMTTNPFVQGQYADPVNDFALIEIPPTLGDWVSPTIADIGGPCGVWDGDITREYVLSSYGHGHPVGVWTGGTPRPGVFFAEPPDPQEQAEHAQPASWNGGPYAGGDSGSPVRDEQGRAFAVITNGTYIGAYGPKMPKVMKIVDGWELASSPTCPDGSGASWEPTPADDAQVRPGHDAVEAAFTTFRTRFAIDARSASDGSSPGGTFEAALGGQPGFSGIVTCLSAHLHRAAAAGRVTRSDSPAVPVGSHVLVLLQDLHRAEDGQQHQPDRFTGAFNLPTAPACPQPGSPAWHRLTASSPMSFPTNPVDSVRIHDAR